VARNDKGEPVCKPARLMTHSFVGGMEMSDDRIPFTVGDLKRVGGWLEEHVENVNAFLGPTSIVRFTLEVVHGPGEPTTPVQHTISKVLRQPAPPPRRARRPRRPRRSGTPTPYQAKRAAMEDLPLSRLRRYGFTPYFGEDKQFLMIPPDFDLVLACESRQVALVIFEVMKQSVGYSGDSAEGRREWVTLSFRHFERRGLLGHTDAKLALDYAVKQGYLLRRRRGRQQWEYAVHYRRADNVPR